MKTGSLLDKEYDRGKYTQANSYVWDKLAKIKGAPFVKYRELLKKAERGEVVTDFPVEVLIKTTLNCNHSCPRCPHGMGIFPKGSEYNMRFDTLKKVLEEGAEKGLQSVVFTGGEPTMHPEFTDFIEYASKKGFPDISVITNGSLLKDHIADCLLDSGVTRINISFDSITPETYKKVRGVDDYQKVLDNIESFLEKRRKKNNVLPLLSISFVLSEDNANELDEFVRIWHEKADGGIKIYPYKDIFSIMNEDFNSVYGSRVEIANNFSTLVHPKKLSHTVPIMEKYSIKCTIPWYRCHVGVYGEIQACTTIVFCDHPLMNMGNIHETTFETAWKSEPWNRLRELTLAGCYDKHPVCKVCQASVRKGLLGVKVVV